MQTHFYRRKKMPKKKWNKPLKEKEEVSSEEKLTNLKDTTGDDSELNKPAQTVK